MMSVEGGRKAAGTCRQTGGGVWTCDRNAAGNTANEHGGRAL